MSPPPTAQEVRERITDLGSQEHVRGGCGLDRPAGLGKGPDNTQHGYKACVPHSRDTDGGKSRTSPDGRGCSRDRRAPPYRDQSRMRRAGGHRTQGPCCQNLPWAPKTARPAGQR